MIHASNGISLFAKFRPSYEWGAHAVNNLITRICCSGERLEDDCVPKALRSLIKAYCFGSEARFASLIGMPKRSIQLWVSGQARPSLPSLIDLCYRINIPPDQLLLDSDILTAPEYWKCLDHRILVISTKLTQDKKYEIKLALNAVLEDRAAPPLSVSTLAKSFGISYTTLEHHFPKEYRIIQSTFTEWRIKNKHDLHIKRIKNLMTGIKKLSGEGIYPSDRQLLRRGYVLPSDLRRPKIIERLRYLQQSFREQH